MHYLIRLALIVLQQVQLLLFRDLHRVRVFLHLEPVHRCHHRQLQRAQEEVRGRRARNVPNGVAEELLHRHEEVGKEETAESREETDQ